MIFLSWLILQKVQHQELLPMNASRSMMATSHFLYADDILLFCRGTEASIKVVVDFIPNLWLAF